MSSTEIIAIITALGVLLSIVGGLVVNVIIAIRRTERKVDDNAVIAADKIDAVNTVAKTIEGHVNSTASASVEKIEALTKEVASMRTMLNKADTTAALLAQAVALNTAKLNPGATPVIADLEKIGNGE